MKKIYNILSVSCLLINFLDASQRNTDHQLVFDSSYHSTQPTIESSDEASISSQENMRDYSNNEPSEPNCLGKLLAACYHCCVTGNFSEERASLSSRRSSMSTGSFLRREPCAANNYIAL